MRLNLSGSPDRLDVGVSSDPPLPDLEVLALLTGSRSTSRSSLGRQQDASAGLGVEHELLRNVILAANVGYTRDDFSGINRTDDTISAGGGVNYLLNRNFSIGAGYNFTTRSSDDKNEEFDRNLIRIGVTGRL